MKAPHLIVAIALLPWTATGQAVPVTFSDGVFPNAAWSAQKFLNGSFSAFQVVTGGKPGEFRETDHSGLNNGQSIIAINTLSSAIYNPSVSGAVNTIDFSFDLKFLGGSSGTSQVGYRLAFEQGGSLYFSSGSFLGIALGPGNGQPGAAFQSFSFKGLTAADFSKQSGSGTLDFSSSGAPVTFGYLTTNTVNLDNSSTMSGIDNWFVRVNPVPVNHIPDSSSSFLLFGLALLAVSPWCVRWRKVVR